MVYYNFSISPIILPNWISPNFIPIWGHKRHNAQIYKIMSILPKSKIGSHHQNFEENKFLKHQHVALLRGCVASLLVVEPELGQGRGGRIGEVPRTHKICDIKNCWTKFCPNLTILVSLESWRQDLSKFGKTKLSRNHKFAKIENLFLGLRIQNLDFC